MRVLFAEIFKAFEHCSEFPHLLYFVSTKTETSFYSSSEVSVIRTFWNTIALFLRDSAQIHVMTNSKKRFEVLDASPCTNDASEKPTSYKILFKHTVIIKHTNAILIHL